MWADRVSSFLAPCCVGTSLDHAESAVELDFFHCNYIMHAVISDCRKFIDKQCFSIIMGLTNLLAYITASNYLSILIYALEMLQCIVAMQCC